MSLKKEVTILIVLGIFISLVHYFATTYAWYWIFQPTDLFMHWLGGFWIAHLSFLVLSRFLRFESKRSLISAVFWCSVAIGIAWEIFEVIFQIVEITNQYPGDTFFDIIMDMAGAGTATLLIAQKLSKDKK